MAHLVDFFFTPFTTPMERRHHAGVQDGLFHGSHIEPRDPAPGQPVVARFITNATLPLDHVALYYTTDGSEPDGALGSARHGVALLARLVDEQRDSVTGLPVKRWDVTIPGLPYGTLVRYRADAWHAATPHLHRYADDADPVGSPAVRGRLFAYSVDIWRAPEWFDDAVIYQIFVDRFNAAHDEPALRDPGSITGFFGGTLAGIMEKLDYIQGLGANTLWLSPVFESPTHHGYNPSSYVDVAQRFGTNDTLRALIAHAHQRGMRVILDFVANHTSDEHPQFREAMQGASDWYSVDEWSPHGYRSYALVRTMPELATENSSVQEYLLNAALCWLQDFGADGLRLDYVPGPPHSFWTYFQRGIKRQVPDALTLGEVTDSPDGLASYDGRLDAVMDFSLAGIMRQVFAMRSATISDLLNYLTGRQERELEALGRATLLDNHDMHRFLWLAGERRERLMLAAACQLTLPGTPIIYYGTEVGLSQYGDANTENAYARAPMIWGERQDRALFQHYQRLIALRQTHASLRHGRWRRLRSSATNADTAADQIGAYLRYEERDAILVVVNNTDESTRVTLPLADVEAHLQRPPHIELLYGFPEEATATTLGDTLAVALPPLGAILLAV